MNKSQVIKVIKKDGAKYYLYTFSNEDELEKLVKKNYKDIFGENSIWFNKEKIKNDTGIGSIPDGFVISIDDKKWYIIEVELSSHDLYQHIVPQISKFNSAIKKPETRKKLLDSFWKDIKDEPYKEVILKVCKIKEQEQYKVIEDIITEDPKIIVIIDNLQNISEILHDLKYEPTAIEFNVFARSEVLNDDSILVFESLITKKPVETKHIEEFKEKTSAQTQKSPEKTGSGKARKVTLKELVKARLVSDGDILYFVHGKNKYETEEAVIVAEQNKLRYKKDGNLYSISDLAKKIDIAKGLKHDKHGVAGPKYWQTKNGELLDDLNNKVREMKSN